MQQLSVPRQFRPQKTQHWDSPIAMLEKVTASDGAVIRFGRCCVLPGRRPSRRARRPRF